MKKIGNLVVVLLFLAAAVARAGSALYTVTADTSSLATRYDYLDFQLDPGSSGFPASTQAYLSNFDLGGGSFNLSDSWTTGSASAPCFLAPVCLDNGGGQTNEYGVGFTFGSYISFQVQLNWGYFSPPTGGSAFLFSMWDNQGNGLLTSAPYPSTQFAEIDVNSDDSTAMTTFPASATSTPEPATLLLLSSALVLAGSFRRGRKRPLAGL